MHDTHTASLPPAPSEHSGHVEYEQKPSSSKARRKIGQVCAALAIGGIPGSFSAAATGIQYDIGPVTVRANPTMTQGFSARVATEAIRAKTGIPGEPGVTIEPIESANIESIEELTEYIVDPEAIGTAITERTYKRVATGGALGAIVILGFMSPFANAVGSHTRRQKQLLATGVGVAGSLFVSPAAAQPSYELATREWKEIGSIEGTHYEYEVSGGVATAAVRELQRNEVYYDTLKDKTIKALDGVQQDPATEGLVPIMASSDQHCRIGMMRVEQGIIEALGIRYVINIGDIVEDGTIDWESLCVSIYEQRVIDNIDQLVFVPGNHDGTKTIEAMRSANAVIAEGEVIDLNGSKVLGDGDPRRNQAGYPRRLRDSEVSEADFAERVRQKAQATNPDILAIHDKKHVTSASSWADLTVSGHFHRYEFDENGAWIQTGSAGGKKKDTYNLTGKLSIPAEFVILYQDPTTHKIAGHRVISINPDGDVGVGEYRERVLADETIPPQLKKVA